MSAGVDEDGALVRGWWEASAPGSAAAGALEEIYAEVAREVAARGPACWASGRCCHFEAAGHRLYVTGLEAAYTVRRAGSGMVGSVVEREGGGLSLAQVSASRDRGDCPYLVGNACGAHAIKPLGCRVYFCDRSAEGWQRDLSESMLSRIRGVHDRHALGYRYGEWRGMLEMVVRLGVGGPGFGGPGGGVGRA